jgi:hypothetical protein
MYFPLKYDFRIGKFSESDTPKNRTLVVRKGVKIILIVTYSPPSHSSKGRFSDRSFGEVLKRRAIPRLQSVGLIVAYATMSLSRHVQGFSHPDNWLYDFDEAGGNHLLIECFREAWAQSGVARAFMPDEADVGTALDLLETPPRASGRRGAQSDASTRYERTSSPNKEYTCLVASVSGWSEITTLAT